MKQSLKEIFNALPADKVVSMREARALSKALYKQMNLADRAYLAVVDKPLSAVGGLVLGGKLITNASLRASFSTVNSDGTLGMYKGADGSYVSIATMQKMLEQIPGFFTNESFQQRLNALAVQAYAQCKDYKADVAAGKLTPVAFG